MARGKEKWICSTEDKPWQKRSDLSENHSASNLRLSGLRHQTFAGWGGCFNEMGWDVMRKLPANRREQVLAALFGKDGCRFTFGRVPIGASDYALDWYSCNETPGDCRMRNFSIERDRQNLIPYIKSAMRHQPGLELFASPWSPPTWMKYPAVYNYGQLIWEKKNLDAYALYFARFVEEYAREGIRISQVHVQNEPVADQKFPSCLWSGAQLRDFIRDHLGPTFRKRRVPAEIWLGTINSDDYNEFALTVLSDPRARELVAGVSYQWAGKHAIHRTLKAFPEVPLMQSENECGDGNNTWKYAHYIFQLFQHYLIHGVRWYVYWNMVLPPGGRSTWGWKQNSMVVVDPDKGTVRYTPEFYVMKHYSHFISPGAVRLGLAGQWAGNAVCFSNPDGSMVLVVANPFEEKRELAFAHPGGILSANLPGQSFNTFVISL